MRNRFNYDRLRGNSFAVVRGDNLERSQCFGFLINTPSGSVKTVKTTGFTSDFIQHVWRSIHLLVIFFFGKLAISLSVYNDTLYNILME